MTHLKKNLENLIDNKKGQIGTQVVWMFVLMGLVAMLLVGYFIYALIAPMFSSYENTLVNSFQGAAKNTGSSIIVNATNMTAGAIDRTIQPNIQWISYGVLIMMFVAFVACMYFVRFYPFMVIFWLLFCIVIIFSSLYLSISYQNIAGSLPEVYRAWAGNDYLITYMPYITVTFSIIGGIFIFMTSKREETDSSLM